MRSTTGTTLAPAATPELERRRVPLRSSVRAGAPGDGTYVCIVIKDKDGTSGAVCEKVT